MLYLDTSVLVPLFVPEPLSAQLRHWFDGQSDKTFAISDWTLTEFSSAMGIKVRDKGLKSDQARKACALMDQLARNSFRVITPTRPHFSRATEWLNQHGLGLRAGDALHLAIADLEQAACFQTFDRRLLDIGRRLKIRAAAPV